MSIRHPGVLSALGAAVLFGSATPLAKGLLASISPWMLAGLLYLGSGLGLALYRHLTSADSVVLPVAERRWFAGAIVSGGIVGPVLLMIGLSRSSASAASLLLNMEGVFTALLAWFAFKENFDRRIALGMLAIMAGAVVLSWPSDAKTSALWPALAILGACLAWGIDNNLTRKVSLTDASWIAMVKGVVAGSVNLLIALGLAAMTIGFLSYGISLVLFVLGLRHLGTARTGAYFSVAPMFGAFLAVLLCEPITTSLVIAALLMGCGVYLHLSEVHEHEHDHDALTHEHLHRHDDHHIHDHDTPWTTDEPHSHRHEHALLTHRHAHYPDAHHNHTH